MDKCPRSRSASTTRGEDAVVAAANIEEQGTNLEVVIEQNVTNVEINSQETIEISDNGNVATNGVENLNLAKQLQSMFNAFTIAMQEESAKAAAYLESKFDKLSEDLEAKLVSKLESKFDKLSEDLDAKLATVSENLDAKLNLVANNMDLRLNAAVANVTSEMKKESAIRLETKIQDITKEAELVKRGTNKELTICMQHCKNECDKVNENVNNHKAQTKTSVESLKGVVKQNREEIENKLGELTREVSTVTAVADECNCELQSDKKNHCLDIQRINAQLEELKEKTQHTEN
jgi:hypothetical protein